MGGDGVSEIGIILAIIAHTFASTKPDSVTAGYVVAVMSVALLCGIVGAVL